MRADGVGLGFLVFIRSNWVSFSLWGGGAFMNDMNEWYQMKYGFGN